MGKAVFLLLLLGFCQAQLEDDKELALILEEIFGKPSTESLTTPAPGIANKEETVSQCETIDGKIGKCTVPSGCTKKLSSFRQSNKNTCIGADEVCCGQEDLISTALKTPMTSKVGCGWRNGDDTRILTSGGSTADFAEFPWVVAVLMVVPEDTKKPDGRKVYLYTSGGSIIHPRVVLTTAHYVYEKDIKLRVRAGEWDTTSLDEILPYQDRNVERIIVHELFNTTRQNLFNDIALLVLENPLDYTLNVNGICLPPSGQRAVEGTDCYSAGWGKSNFGVKGSYQTILKKVQIPVIARNECQRQLRQTRLGPVFKLHTSFMCAGGIPNQDTCTGDGGSPLMCPINGQTGRYTASGMVAWGLGCGDAVPAVYVDVAALRPWVDAKMAELGFDQDTYTY